MTRLTLAFCGLMLLAACNSSKKTTESDSREPNRTSQRGDRRSPSSADEAMARLDANSDGKLSMDEVSGRLKENFSRIDSNGDGFITKTELETNRPKGGLGPPRS